MELLSVYLSEGHIIIDRSFIRSICSFGVFPIALHHVIGDRTKRFFTLTVLTISGLNNLKSFLFSLFTINLVTFFCWNDEKRNDSMMQNFFCHTSHDYIFQPSSAMRAHDNNIRMQLFCCL
jgi:hypothetical protein